MWPCRTYVHSCGKLDGMPHIGTARCPASNEEGAVRNHWADKRERLLLRSGRPGRGAGTGRLPVQV